jgi:hypothetical protein
VSSPNSSLYIGIFRGADFRFAVASSSVFSRQSLSLAASGGKFFAASVLKSRAPVASSSRSHIHRKTIATRERTRTFSPEQAALRRASAIFFTDLRRRNLERDICQTCGRADAVPHWPDPAKPLDVTWLCRVHRENRTCPAR